MMLVNALQAAGAFVDLFAGFSLSTIYDPFNNVAGRDVRPLLRAVAMTLLFTTNAYLILVNGFFRSFDVDPRGRALASARSRRTCSRRTWASSSSPRSRSRARSSRCLFLAEITLGLLARAAPNLNVFALAFPLRVDHRARRRRARAAADLARRSATSCATRSRPSATDAEPEPDRWPPTARRRPRSRPHGGSRRAREKGQIAKSPDLSAWVGMLATIVLLQIVLTRGASVMPRRAPRHGRW